MNGSAWVNYSDVTDQLLEAGFDVTQPEVGVMKRCKVAAVSQKGWYSLHELRLDDGRFAVIGAYGWWVAGDKFVQNIELRIGDDKPTLSDEQRAAVKLRMAEARKSAERSRAFGAAKAADEATRAWGKYSFTGECGYLADKGVQAHGVKFTAGNSLVVPLADTSGKIHGLQLIYPKGHPKRAKLGRDKDFWPFGIAVAGHFHLIGVPHDVLVVTEGYATGATIFEATGIAVAVAFNAGNLQPVAVALHRRYPKTRILIAADDDYLVKHNPGCQKYTPQAEPLCAHCGEAHKKDNAGIAKAAAAALAVGGAWVAPAFAIERPTDKKGPTDFNDLAASEGAAVVAHQLTTRLAVLGWNSPPPAPSFDPRGEGRPAESDLLPLQSIDDMQDRYSIVYEMGDMVFDAQEHALVGLTSMRNICTNRQIHRMWMESANKRIVRVREIGFDPTESDAAVKCNLYGGFPSIAKAGACSRQLELLEYLCSYENNTALFQYVLRWLAFPLQHIGAKMTSALLLHGPQGVGKNIIFERAMLAIYGRYGAIIGQDQIDSKHNKWQSHKLYMFADEIMTRAELYQNKNKVKGMITSDFVTINPKGVDEYAERNHCNLVFASNDIKPMAIERDDRRFTVIWTPPAKEADYYQRVGAEQREGGIAALHDYLLNLSIGDFGQHTKPLMTKAKADLQSLGMESTDQFCTLWLAGHLPVAVEICRSDDLYAAYRHWCAANGTNKPAQANTFIHTTAKQPGAQKLRKRIYVDLISSTTTQTMLIFPPGSDTAAEIRDLTEQTTEFRTALEDWKNDGSPIARIRRAA